MLLGVVLAGGRSTRFGSDKALAELDGTTLLAGAVERLSGWCEDVIVAGRAAAPARTVPDWPRPGMGPLGGLAASLRLAADEGYRAVFSVGVDTLGLPEDILRYLEPAPACLISQPVVGLWPAGAAPVIEQLLRDAGARHSLFAFAERAGARRVALPGPVGNVNTDSDLRRWREDRR